MLERITSQEILTVMEFKQKYSDKWFCYVIVEKEEEWMYKQPEDVKAKVLYLADSENELVKLPLSERRAGGFNSGGIGYGIKVNPEP